MIQKFKKKILERFNLDVTVRHQGRRFVIPIRGGLQCIRPTEPYLVPIIRQLLSKRRGIFLDIGANTGQTLLKVRLACDDAEYVGIEPDTACASYIDELIRCNGFEGCVVVCCAISSSDGFSKLFSRTGVHQISSTKPETRSSSVYDGYHVVPSVTGDQLVRELASNKKISVIKIDVEGAECEVVAGLDQTIRRMSPAIIFEFLPLDSEFGFWDPDDSAVAMRKVCAETLKGTAWKTIPMRSFKLQALEC